MKKSVTIKRIFMFGRFFLLFWSALTGVGGASFVALASIDTKVSNWFLALSFGVACKLTIHEKGIKFCFYRWAESLFIHLKMWTHQ